MTTMKSNSEQAAANVAALLRARNSFLWVVTGEEERVERYLFEAAASVGYVARTWDVAQGVAEMDGKVNQQLGSADPAATMAVIAERAERGSERGVWIMRDLPAWLEGPPMAATLRQARNLARSLPTTQGASAQAVIVLTPKNDVPPELSGHVTVIEWPLPDRTEIAAMLDVLVEQYDLKFENGERESAIDAAIGLTGEEAQACYARSIVQLRRVDPKTVAAEKKRVIAKEKVLEWSDPLPEGLDAIGGLDALKKWLKGRSMAYSPAARAYGLPAPKGVLLVGVPGCGKSMTAKAAATAFQVPLLRGDLGALKSKFVGESEQNLRKMFRVVESTGRCVLWFDELEKALAGATQGAADGGVSADALGAILSWMQEKQGDAFVIATCNDIEKLPPELLRKGRFDEIFFVDLPNDIEREAVLASALRQYGRGAVPIDLAKAAAACEEFTGSEIAAIVPDALFAAFADGAREITTEDLIDSARTVVPLAKIAAEKINKLRDWAKGRARPATSEVVAPTEWKRQVRALDL